MKRNLSQKAREKGDYTWAALHESDAGFRLAQLGMVDESVASLLQAAQDAERGSHAGDPYFAITCRLLARYLDRTRLGHEELSEALDVARLWDSPFLDNIVQATQLVVHNNIIPDAELLQKWQTVCKRYAARSNLSSTEVRILLILIHLAALLGRYYAENFEIFHPVTSKTLLEAIISIQGAPDVIFDFVRGDYAEKLIQEGQFQKSLDICQRVLVQEIGENAFPLERFVFRQLIARASLALGDNWQAYTYAALALSDWKRVLNGLYDEKHKVSWLERGASVLSCAINAIRYATDWMPEQERRQELFRLLELGKARLVTDMVSHPGYLSDVYAIPGMLHRHNDPDLLLQENPDWYVPFALQSRSFADVVQTVVHDESGRSIGFIPRDASVFRDVIHLPLAPEKRLYRTADSLSFEELPISQHNELYTDLLRMNTPEEGDTITGNAPWL